MRIAVICFAFKNPQQIILLYKQFKKLKDCEVKFFLHVDKKNENLFSEINNLPDFFKLKNNIDITWGNDSMVSAFSNATSEVKSYSETFDYYIYCTGQDFLVRDDLISFLSQNDGKIFLDMEPLTNHDSEMYKKYLSCKFPKFVCKYAKAKFNFIRIIRAFYRRLILLNFVKKKKSLLDISKIKLYYSFCWSMLPHNAFCYLSEFIQNNSSFMNLYKNAFLPEDYFLGTIIMNSPLAENVCLLDNGSSFKTTYCPPLVNQYMSVMTIDSIPKIHESKCFLARKFDINIDSQILDYYYNIIK